MQLLVPYYLPSQPKWLPRGLGITRCCPMTPIFQLPLNSFFVLLAVFFLQQRTLATAIATASCSLGSAVSFLLNPHMVTVTHLLQVFFHFFVPFPFLTYCSLTLILSFLLLLGREALRNPSSLPLPTCPRSCWHAPRLFLFPCPSQDPSLLRGFGHVQKREQ